MAAPEAPGIPKRFPAGMGMEQSQRLDEFQRGRDLALRMNGDHYLYWHEAGTFEGRRMVQPELPFEYASELGQS